MLAWSTHFTKPLHFPDTSNDRLLLEDFSAQFCHKVTSIILCQLLILKNTYFPLYTFEMSPALKAVQKPRIAIEFTLLSISLYHAYSCYEYTPLSHLLLIVSWKKEGSSK